MLQPTVLFQWEELTLKVWPVLQKHKARNLAYNTTARMPCMRQTRVATFQSTESTGHKLQISGAFLRVYIVNWVIGWPEIWSWHLSSALIDQSTAFSHTSTVKIPPTDKNTCKKAAAVCVMKWSLTSSFLGCCVVGKHCQGHMQIRKPKCLSTQEM